MNLASWLKSSAQHIDRRYLKGDLYLHRYCRDRATRRKIQAMSQRPVLIGGCGRSGTTLLLSLLSAHRHLYAIPDETLAFCPSAYSAERDYEQAFTLELLYSRLVTVDPHLLHSRTRWVEKTPKNVHFIGRLIDYFGEGLRFINIVRDGRDVVTSLHPTKPHTYWVAPERWVDDVAAGLRFEEHPQVLTVRYEDLVADYRSVLGAICAFLGEAYDEAFDAYPDSATVRTSRAWYGQATEVSRTSLRRWEQPQHAAVVQQLTEVPRARALLAHYGYL